MLVTGFMSIPHKPTIEGLDIKGQCPVGPQTVPTGHSSNLSLCIILELSFKREKIKIKDKKYLIFIYMNRFNRWFLALLIGNEKNCWNEKQKTRQLVTKNQ